MDKRADAPLFERRWVLRGYVIVILAMIASSLHLYRMSELAFHLVAIGAGLCALVPIAVSQYRWVAVAALSVVVGVSVYDLAQWQVNPFATLKLVYVLSGHLIFRIVFGVIAIAVLIFSRR
jgi:hypothetical protein